MRKACEKQKQEADVSLSLTNLAPRLITFNLENNTKISASDLINCSRTVPVTNINRKSVITRRKKRKIGSDLLEQIENIKTKRNLYQDRNYYEDKIFVKDISNIQDKVNELNGAGNLNTYLEIDLSSDEEKDKNNINNEIAELDIGECEWND